MPKTLILTEDAQQDLDNAYQWYQELIRCVDAKLSEILFCDYRLKLIKNELESN